MLGVVYHLNYETNLNILKYIRGNCKKCYFSSHLFSSGKRPNVDWEITKDGHLALFQDAGFQELITCYEKQESDDWSALTNQWYFEAR